jgi:hypothetical protein
MATVEFDLLCAFESHSVAEIRAILDAGLDITAPIKGKSVVNSLIEMYTRSDAFPGCLRLLMKRGAVLDDPRIAPVLLDDADGLAAALRADPSLIHHRTSMLSTFTPLVGASLLHVAAEYGNVKAARVLVQAGADVNARASLDEHGLNGHTPIFHTVNSNDNRAAPILELLLAAGADPGIRLAGITWGKGFEWETTCFDVTPISYAQLGLLPQMHRIDRHVYANIKRLLKASGRKVPPLANVPNRYLKG